MELDNEVKDNGNSYTTEFRQYDPRLGRWLSLDPLMASFPHVSPYVGFADNPVLFIDPYGLSPGNGANEGGGAGDKTKWKPIQMNTDIEGNVPKNIKVLETYSCDKEYKITLDDNTEFKLNVTNKDVKKFECRGITFEAKYNTTTKKKGEFLGYFDKDGNMFNQTMHYGYASHEFTDDETFNKNLAAAFKHYYDHTDQYGWESDDGSQNEEEENYNCFEFALALTSGKEVDYDNIIYKYQDSKLAQGYISVPKSQAIPGKTIIRFSIQNGGENIADHFAIYLGKNSKGQTIIATKNGNSVQPKIMLLKDLCLQHWIYGPITPAPGDSSGYYNPIE